MESKRFILASKWQQIMINIFTRSPLKAVVGRLAMVFLLIIAAGCVPESPEVEEGGGLGGSGEEIEQEGEIEEEEEAGEED